MRTVKKPVADPAFWLEELPEAVKQHLIAMEMTRAQDFAMSFVSPDEIVDELKWLALSEDDLRMVVECWERQRGATMEELKQAKLPGSSASSQKVQPKSAATFLPSRIRKFEPVVGRDGHRHGLTPAKRPKPASAPPRALMPQQTYDDIIDVLVRVGGKSTRPLPGLIEDEQSARLFLARSLQGSSESRVRASLSVLR